jgi:hypothetical protein
LAYAALPAEQVPESVRAEFRWAYEESAARAADAYWQIADVLHALRAEKIIPMLLKGAAMARFFYRDPAVRLFSDIDLLIRRDDIQSAHRCLRAAGYDIIGGEPTKADMRWRHARGYFDPAGRRMTVDLHWRYSGFPYLLPLPYAEVFERCSKVVLADAPVLIQSPADVVLGSSVYFVRELWYGKPKLRYLRDAAEVVDRFPVDWDLVLARARDIPLIRFPLRATLSSAEGLLGASIPAEVLATLGPRRWSGVERRLLARICRKILEREAPTAAVGQVSLMRLLDSPSFLDFLGWVKTLIFIPRPLAESRRRRLRYLSRG